jgi:hypothetical protein
MRILFIIIHKTRKKTKSKIMKNTIIILLLLTSTLISGKDTFLKPVMSWQEGMYVEYLMEWEDGSWESYRYFLHGKDKEGDWILSLTVKSPEHTEVMLTKLTRPNPKDEFPIKVTKNKTLRGTISEKYKKSLWIMLANEINSWEYYKDEIKKGEKNNLKVETSDYGCGIDRVAVYEDKWDEFGYIKYHDFNPAIPITGKAGIRTNDKRFTMKVLSYGRNTRDSNYQAQPDYIDFSHLKEVKYDDFTLTFPASWVLGKQRDDKQYKNYGTFHFKRYILGGNTHYAFMVVSIQERSKYEEVRRKLQGDEDPGHMKLKFVKKYSFKSKNNTEAFIYHHSVVHRLKYGAQITGLFKNKSHIAKVTIYVSFIKNISRSHELDSVIVQMEKIIKTFSFNEGE